MTSLPTFEKLGASPPKDIGVDAIGRAWTAAFSERVSAHDIPGILSLLYEDGWWRDIYALTWDLRTFEGIAKTETFLRDRIDEVGLTAVSFRSAEFAQVYPDMAWVVVEFSFETHVGIGRGISRLVYTADGLWKAAILCTILDGLKGHPELPKDQSMTHIHWEEERRRELEFADRDPEVLIIGSGQSGLIVAARLKALGVSHLVLEKNERIGDNWRQRYESLSLHNITAGNHFPYIPFPASWPAYIPSKKFANWLEFYADALDLNVWTSSMPISATRDTVSGQWTVAVSRSDGSERIMHVDHIVLAYGYPWKNSSWVGQSDFEGQIVHSSSFRRAKDFVGKKVFVIGACSSGHDVARDCADIGIDVTLFQRSSTYVISVDKAIPHLQPPHIWESGDPVEDVDIRKIQSIPWSFQKLIARREEPILLEIDKANIEALQRTGYRVARYPEGPVIIFLAAGGGYYLDTGGSRPIIEGKVKIKNDAQISRFTHDGILFDDGSEVKTDVVVVATGFDDIRVSVKQLIGEELGAQLPPIWGLDDESEPYNVWRDLAPVAPNMWPMLGNIGWVRFFSKHMALQIKAKQEGLYGTRYAAPTLG